jgi:hypothetical protein
MSCFYTFGDLKRRFLRIKKFQISNGEFHALPDLSPLLGFVGICSSPRKHFGRPLPLFSSCNKSKMFLDAFMSLSLSWEIFSILFL